MDIDRKKICAIISEMLDNGDKLGIYPTGKAYDELENYIMVARGEGIVPPERPKEKCVACEGISCYVQSSLPIEHEHIKYLLNQHHTCEKKDA